MTDQRGDGFPRVINDVVDIGAFEAGTLHHLHIDREESIVNNVSPLQWSTIAGDPGATVLATVVAGLRSYVAAPVS